MISYRELRKGDGLKLVEILKDLSIMFNHENFNEDALINDPACNCIVVEKENIVIGFGALITYRTPAQGMVGRIEDVIVNERYRGMGIGRGTMGKLIAIAKEKNISTIYLTSNPARVPARKLYESLGFVTYNTDVFKLSL